MYVVSIRSWLGVVCLAWVIAGPEGTAWGQAPTSSTALETVRRLKGMDFEANPALKGALLRVVDSTRGTPDFVELVRDFKLSGQIEGLLDVAIRHSETSAGVEAVRLAVGEGGAEVVSSALKNGPPAHRLGLLKACAAAAEPHLLPVLTTTIRSEASSTEERAVAVRGLARSEAGSRELLKLAEELGLEEPTRTTASLVLAQSRWPEVRSAAARLLPLPKSADGAELPTVSELVKASGDAKRGAEVFRSEKAACSKCHRVGETGVDFGPALSQIGTKLGRQALYEAILDPSSGISFGYEGWSVETRDGEEIFGMLASDTPDGVAIKQQSGAVIPLKRSDVLRMERQKLSVMPAGLGSILSRQELVDLVEYLTTLRAP